MSNIYSTYTPLRNILFKQRLNESLLAIHSHIQFQQFKQPLPNYIVGEPVGYRQIKSFKDQLDFHLFPWDLAILCKEILLNSPRYGASKNLLNWYYLSSAINKLKDIDGRIADQYMDKDNVLLEFFRISHRQFHWQRVPTLEAPARYWKLFQYKGLKEVVEKSIGLKIEDIILIGMAMVGFFKDKIAIFYPPKINIAEIDNKKLDIFLNHFCIDLETLKAKLKSEQQYDERFMYSYSSLVAYPLIKMEWDSKDAIVCPIPTYLFERITDGIYYEIYKAEGFDKSFGFAFQDYVGDVIKRLSPQMTIYPEVVYDKGKRSIDWIIEDDKTILFIECKTKRLRNNAKVELLDTQSLISELSKLADGIIQIYKAINDYKIGKYLHLKNNLKKPIHPILVTLENWFVYGEITSRLDKLVIQKLEDSQMNKNLVNENPYIVMPINTFEQFIHVSNEDSFEEILKENLYDKEKRYWEFENCLHAKYSKLIATAQCPFIPDLKKQLDSLVLSNK